MVHVKNRSLDSDVSSPPMNFLSPRSSVSCEMPTSLPPPSSLHHDRQNNTKKTTKRTRSTTDDEGEKKKKKKRNPSKPSTATATATTTTNGTKPSSSHNHNHTTPQPSSRRRTSLGKAPRDPHDRFPPPGSTSPLVVDAEDGLSRPGLGTRQRRAEEEGEEEEQGRGQCDDDDDDDDDDDKGDKKKELASHARLDRMRGAVRTLLECVGEDPDREGLLDTPARYAKALLFLTSGYQVSLDNLVNNALFREGHNEMVIVKDIQLQSLCEHHLVPFVGKMHIGYIPSDTVIGLSKLPRIADMYARRLQIQERLTKDVAHAIMHILKPQGVAVVMESSHLCMVMRGVQQTTSSTITSCVLGCFERKSKTRNEFFSLVGLNSRPS
ncbi:hypothetical protein L249_3738 [Ophiocordyceps polyrhachis-furcata BCC 54312]|uniref:GTP cyclohydrolase 1 n=1 Tax=Ophiocordyceps polyrhachis-furcata BCC 54312 TaxID=1330021 RepID=A0A367L4V6_9HYPO|nr:hypothetical protein L249_3738 [Ophiocordyceps polyrhachis-furcata BCC 54312]